MESTTVPTRPPRSLTVAIAARRLNVAEKTIYRAIDRGEIRSFRVGRAIRIPESALEELGQR